MRRALCCTALLASLCFPAFSGQARAAVLYVRADARTGGDGRTWQGALRDLPQALSAAQSGDAIWVANGTYYPTAGSDREASFTLKKGVSLYGGFSGAETQLSERDWRRNPTILSGDVGEKGVAEDNVYHVVLGADEAVIDGFLITGGYGAAGRPSPGGVSPPGGRRPGAPSGARRPPGPNAGKGPGGQGIHITPQQVLGGPSPGNGAGMINYQSAPTVRNCIFENNRAGKGGGVYNMVNRSFPPRPGENAKAPTFIDCVFRRNQALGRGGGVSNDLGTSPVFLGCVFEANETPAKGGGMYNDFGCSPVLINCLFKGNRASSAGALGNDGGSAPVIYYCTFTGNHAEDAGPSLYQGTGPSNNPSLIRSIVWGNTCDWEGVGLYNWHDNSPVVEESVVEGGYGSAATADPGLDEAETAGGDAGYKPGDPRFAEEKLAGLLSALAKYRPAIAARPGDPGRPTAAASETTPSSDRVVYVNGALSRSGDGRSWGTAHASLNEALEDAGRDGAEIRVAAGVYRPWGADRAVSFRLRPGVRLYGGFAGSESRRDERDWKRNVTTLSGDIGVPGKAEDNAYHVLIGANGAVVDGFRITQGYADGTGYDGKAGGMINYRRGPQERPNLPSVSGYSPEVRNCIFADNYARDGGAVYNYDRGKPLFAHCVFTRNRAENGGAILDRVGTQATYEECEFRGNTARWRGGAAYFDYGARPNLNGCIFSGNSTSGHGGAVFSVSRASQLENSFLTLLDCRFENNTAKGNGGAAGFHDSTIAALRGCSFSGNKAGMNGGAVALTDRSSLRDGSSEFDGNTAGKEGNDVYRSPDPPNRGR